jgi:hypothetical protein
VKLPHVLFRLINPMMAALLRSPLHGIASASLLVLAFTGRKSGRRITLPLRYATTDEGFVCFTTDDAKWWHNFERPRPASVVVAGRAFGVTVTAQRVAAGESLDQLRWFLSLFPQDADYHEVAVADGRLDEVGLQRAVARSIRVSLRRD